MSIKQRLLLAYSAMLMVTILSIVSLGFVIAIANTGDLKGVQQFYTSQYLIKPLTPQEESVFLDAKYLAKKNPVRLLDIKLLREIDHRLISVSSGLVVRREEEILFSSPSLHVNPMEWTLPPYEMANIKVRDTLENRNQFFTYVKFDFNFDEQSRGSLYVLKEVSPYGELARKWLPILVAIFIAVIILTNGLLNYLVSRSIIKPLEELKVAAEKIKEGHLQSGLRTRSNDEIGKLVVAFEEMRRRLKDSIELQFQYEKNRKELLSNISHDLKTPITTIKGYVEGIRDGVANTPEKMEKYLATIYSKTVAMNQMIDELFLFSKLDLKKDPFTFDEVEIVQFVSDYIEELHFDLGEKGIRLEFDHEFDDPVFVRADREKLKRVFSNIIENSMKYMDKEHKSLRLRLSQAPSPNQIMIQIEDNGSGISEDAIHYIFDRFFREELSRSSITGGSGLGLAIAKHIIEQHGGKIWAASQRGRGTAIFFTLLKVDRKVDQIEKDLDH